MDSPGDTAVFWMPIVLLAPPPRHPQYLCVGAASSDMLPKELSHTHTHLHTNVDGDQGETNKLVD